MEKAFDQASICRTLRNGLQKGYWTLENLDTPSGGWQLNESQWRKHVLNTNSTHRLHRNLLRNEEDADMY